MTRGHFISLLNGETPFRAEDVEELGELASQHPYSSTFKLMYLRGLKETDSIHYQTYLKRFSLQVPDRRKLFNYLEQSAPPENSEATTAPPLPSVDEKAKEETGATEPEGKCPQYSREISPAPARSVTLPEETDPTEETPSEETPSEPSPLPRDPVEREIMVSAVRGQLFTEIQADIEESSTADTEEQEKEEKEPQTSGHQPLGSPNESERPRSFTDWLDGSAGKAAPKAGTTKGLSSLSQETEDLDAIRDLVSRENEKRDQPAPFFSPSEMARKSTVEDQELVTETLAEIHFQQGHYQKAKEAFEQLQSRFPSKSDYFAGRIAEAEAAMKK